MACFLYYIPGPTPASAGAIPGELSKTLGDTPISVRGVNCGPDNMQGSIVCPEKVYGDKPRIGYYKDTQKWIKASDYWVGWEVAAPPKPLDLQKDIDLDGYTFVLGDKNEWVCPVVLGVYSSIQQGFKTVDGRAVEYVTIPGYEDMIAVAERLRGASAEDATEEDKAYKVDMLDYAIDVLQIHYRLGVVECSVDCLMLLNPRNVPVVLYAAIDGPRAAEEEAMAEKEVLLSG